MRGMSTVPRSSPPPALPSPSGAASSMSERRALGRTCALTTFGRCGAGSGRRSHLDSAEAAREGPCPAAGRAELAVAICVSSAGPTASPPASTNTSQLCFAWAPWPQIRSHAQVASRSASSSSPRINRWSQFTQLGAEVLECLAAAPKASKGGAGARPVKLQPSSASR